MLLDVAAAEGTELTVQWRAGRRGLPERDHGKQREAEEYHRHRGVAAVHHRPLTSA